jgi:cobalt-precorrin-5B (C1)-methyltransferase
MWPESHESKNGEQPVKLKTGLTTGCCATACCVAAVNGLFKKVYGPQVISVTLPRRKRKTDDATAKVVELSILDVCENNGSVTASTIKDAGDDPDVTHGAKIWVSLKKINNQKNVFMAGKGVGTVTREGLSLAIGEPAINPVPRQMMTEHLQHLSEELGYDGGFQITVGIEDGEALALKTMNPRLGIVGGLSVLGTSGIVRPFSCAAYIASIHQGVDVALANDLSHIAASTGNLSEQAIQQKYNLNEMAMIEMGDFIGALLKHIKSRFKQNKTVPQKVSICAGFGKLTKLADGHMDLHSKASSINFERLSHWAKQLGGTDELQEKIRLANTSIEVLALCQAQNLNLAALVCQAAKQNVHAVIPDVIEVEIFAVDRKGQFIGSSHE